MQYITITYKKRDTTTLSPVFTTLLTNFTEVPTKKFLWPIPGLVSRSFEYSRRISANAVQSSFNHLPMWIKHGLKSVEQPELQSNTVEKYSHFVEVSFGYLTSNVSYTWSERITDYNSLQWQPNTREKYLIVRYQNNELRLNQDCLMKYFIISTAYPGFYIIILPLKATPRCYIMSRGRGRFNERTLNFGTINSACLADSSALCLQFPNQNSLSACAQFLIAGMNLDCHYGPTRCGQMSTQAPHFDNILADFWSTYAYQMLLALGYRIKQHITIDTLRKIMKLSDSSKGKPYSNNPCYLKLLALYYRALRNHFFDINEEFDGIQPMPSSIVLDKWEYVPRIYLTPCGIYPLPIKPMRGNRILRERELFGPADHFCRVIIRDIDLGQPQKDFMLIVEQWIKNLLIGADSIIVGDRQFYFLLCSNSQLRDRSFWFHAPYGNHGADHIRQWMGDFTHEKCVGRRIARMALSLTGTTPTITLLPEQIERIEDVCDGQGRQFTDGIGKISPIALREALKKFNPELIEDDYMPCVIQARLNGIKGVFVLAPDLDPRGILIQYRDSQHKFHTNHNVLEIVKHASSGMAFLNRQVIFLLENMGVPEHIFLKLQNKARMKISMSLLANKSAQRTLEQHVRSFDWERMRQSGIQLTREPFARGLLLLLAHERLRRLKEKSQVQISLSDGRMLLGTVDETNSLRYGQVFIQLRDLDGQRQILNNRKVLVTKNPAHFPGDVRVLEAVDCAALHHLSECIVFPAEGERPHPNEISGSDLDGDEYWVCWQEELVNSATEQRDPANFDSAEKTEHPGEITMQVMVDFLFKYLSSDSLGSLSNRHLVCCALYKPNHEYSLCLAEVISQAVDFPKTGVLPKIPKHIKIDQYPDFMEKKFKQSFESDSSIGKMYRQVNEVWKLHSTWQENLEDQAVSVDPNLLMSGYEEYVSKAVEDYEYYSSRINTLLSIYNLQTEYELITGCHSCPEEEKQNNNSAETALLEFRQLCKEMRGRFAEDELSYLKRLRKASAWYYVAYKAGNILSFGWIMDRYMSEINRLKRLPHEEHQALQRIGKAVYSRDLAETIKAIFRSFTTLADQFDNVFETEVLGRQFLEVIDRYSTQSSTQEYSDKLLVFLHEIALNIY